MYQQDLDIGQPDGHSTMHLAVHHLQLAAAMFERFPPEMYLSVLSVHINDIPESVKGMLAVVTAEMELEIWLRDWKERAGREIGAFSKDDPAITPIWDRYDAAMRERLTAAGWTEDQVKDELGDMASVVHEFWEANA